MIKTILPGQTIGIIGGGQLGRMMALAAKEAGFKIAVLDPGMDSPTGQVADIQIVAPFDDPHALEELAEVSDVITYEFENIDVEGLKKLAEIAYVPQGAELIRVTQNRIFEKQSISEAGVVVADYITASSFEELTEKHSKLAFPFVVKTARGGYDGKGQQTVSSIDELAQAEALFENGDCAMSTVKQLFCRSVKIFIKTISCIRRLFLHELGKKRSIRQKRQLKKSLLT